MNNKLKEIVIDGDILFSLVYGIVSFILLSNNWLLLVYGIFSLNVFLFCCTILVLIGFTGSLQAIALKQEFELVWYKELVSIIIEIILIFLFPTYYWLGIILICFQMFCLLLIILFQKNN